MITNNLTARYKLPPLSKTCLDDKTNILIKKAKALNYAEKMPIKFSAISNPEAYYQKLKTIVSKPYPQFEKEIIAFSGTTSDQLQELIDSLENETYFEIRIISDNIHFQHTLKLRSRLSVIANGCLCTISNTLDIAIIAESLHDIQIMGLNFTEGGNSSIIMLLDCQNIILQKIQITKNNAYGIIVRQQSSYIQIIQCTFLDNQRSGIMIHDGSHLCQVTHSIVRNGNHCSNWSAGIVISALEPSSKTGVRDAFEENYFYPLKLDLDISSVAHQNLVEFCEVSNCRSSGIYIDGGNGNVLFNNYINNNEKEGICLDFYAATNLLYNNSIHANGHRNRQTDKDLIIDGVLIYGRMADGSATAKLPNISLDNAALNIIYGNNISSAGGDGIKIVRSGFRNFFALNIINDNNKGHNSIFSYCGILLGSAGAEVENDTSGLDRVASYENQIFANTIYGAHETGIVVDINSTYNDIFDNSVNKQCQQAIVVHDKPNSVIGNNFTIYKASRLHYYWGRIKIRIKRIMRNKLG